MNRINLILVISLCCQNGYSQTQDSMILPQAEVWAYRYESAGIRWKNDSSLKQSGMPVSEQLLFQMPMAMRTNGPTGLSLPALRGLSGAHTAIIWNGIPLQSAMNGLLDLQLLSMSNADLQMVRGGNATIYGSGAIGGAIFLEEPWKGTASNLQLSVRPSSFGNRSAIMDLELLGKKSRTSARLNYSNNRNEFPYVNPYLGKDPIRQILKHAASNSTAVQLSHGQVLSRSISLKTHVWWQKDFRQLPANMLESQSQAEQMDDNLRLAAILSGYHEKSEWQWISRTAYLDESIHFRDLPKDIDDVNRARSLIQKVEIERFLDRNSRLQFIGQHQSTFAKVAGYGGRKQQHQGFLTGVYTRKSSKWRWHIANQSMYGLQKMRWLLPSVELARHWYGAERHQRLIFTVNRNYRIPTLNDLYWNPGGNPELEPELAMRYEAGYDHISRKWQWQSRVYAYKVSNMIVWQPGAYAYWSPVNIGQVNSAGLEQQMKLQLLRRGDFSMDLNVLWQLNRSVDGSQWAYFQSIYEGRQNIYMPVSILSNGLVGRWKSLTARYQWNHQSARYAWLSNDRMLPSFHLHHVYIQWQGKRFSSGLSMMNLFDHSYELLAYYPMPGRFISFNLSYQINIKNKSI